MPRSPDGPPAVGDRGPPAHPTGPPNRTDAVGWTVRSRANRRRSPRVCSRAWSRASPKAPRGSTLEGLSEASDSARGSPLAKTSPATIWAEHRAGGRAVKGAPPGAREARAEGPTLTARSPAPQLRPVVAAGASNGGRGRPHQFGSRGQRRRAGSADGHTGPCARRLLAAPTAVRNARQPRRQPRVSCSQRGIVLEGRSGTMSPNSLRRVSGIRMAFWASASPPRRTDAVICGRACLQGFRSEGGEDVRSCPRTPWKMSRDAVDLFGLVAHGARDGADGPLIQDVWCSLSGGAGRLAMRK